MIENSTLEVVKDSRQVGEVAASVTQLLRKYDTVRYVLGLKQARTVKNWVEKGTLPADPMMETRLRVTEKLALTVKDEQKPWLSGAWLISGCPQLREDSPMILIQSLNGTEQDERILDDLQFAADYFASLED